MTGAGDDGWPFRGRDRELTAIGELMASGEAGIVLRGEAGVGKSRLLREILASVAANGADVERVTGLVGNGNVQFGPVVHLLPEPGLDPSQIDLIWRAVAGMRERASNGVVVLGVDDAHALDQASATLVHHLMISGAVQVVMTLAAEVSMPAQLASLLAGDGLREMSIERLDKAATRSVVDGALSGRLGDKEFETLWSVSKGLPFVIHEVIEGARETGVLRESGSRWIAEGSLVANTRLTSIVESRLASLDPDERHGLELLSLAEPIDLGCLGRLIQPDVLERLDARGFLDLQNSGNRVTVRAAHGLHTEVLRSGIPEIRRRRLLADLAETLGTHGMRRVDDLVRSAIWRLNSGEKPPPALLVEAAQQAVSLFDPLLGEQLARAALPNPEPFGALLVLAQSLSGQGRFDEADEAFREMLNVTTSIEDIVNGGIAFGFYLSWHRHDPKEALRVLESIEAELQGTPRHLLAAHRANVLLAVNRLQEAFDTAVAVLGEPGLTPRAELLALNTSATAAALMGRCDRALADVERGSAMLMTMLDEDAGRIALFSLPCASFLANLHLGRTEEARAIAFEQHEFASAVGARVLVAGWRMLGAEVELMLGRPVTAVAHLRESIGILRDTDVFQHLPLALSFLVRAAVSCGELDMARVAASELDQLTSSPTIDTVIGPARAWIAAAEGRMDAAIGESLLMAADADIAGQWVIEARVLHAIARFGAAGRVVERLRSLSERVDGGLITLFVSHARAHASGNPADLEAVSELFVDVDVVVAAESAAAASIRYSRRGDEAGALRARRRCEELLARCESVTSPTLEAMRARTSTPGLTRREADIAVLAARGDSNRTIGASLNVSVRTVENHLYRIYAKLGVDNREGLAERLASPGARDLNER